MLRLHFTHVRRTLWEQLLKERLEGRKPTPTEIEEAEKRLLAEPHYHGIAPLRPSKRARRSSRR